MTTQIPPCKFCEKKGLPILPIRFGVAPAKAFDCYKFNTAPPDATQFLAAPEVALTAPDTRYTGRMLRAGYLYVYYQTHKLWEAFAVDSGGCLSKVALTNDAPPGGDRFHASCARDATRVANASVLTIEDPETAGTVWIGFSDAWWTKTVRGNVAGLADTERAKFMRKVDVTGWFNGGKTGGDFPLHAVQVQQVGQAVAEYAMPIADGALAFAWTAPGGFFPVFTERSAATLTQECDALIEGKGIVLQLPDPVGLARELPLYMQARWAAFSNPYSRPLQVDADLTQLQQIIRRQAEDNLVKKFYFQQNGAQPLAEWALESAGGAIVHGLRDVFGTADNHPDVAVPQVLTDASVQKYCADTWKPYAAAINHAKRAAFKQDFAAKSKAYDDSMMVPLATAHASWMQSATTQAVFDHHYDPDDINTGVGFTTVFTACVSGTAGMGACQKLYAGWLQQGAKSSVPAMNLLWRALLCNHPELAAKVKTVHTGVTSAGSGSTVTATDSWTALFATFKLVAGKLHFAGEQATKSVTLQSHVGTLTGELGGTMVSIIQARDPASNDLLATLGMHAGAPAKVVTVYGTLDDVNRSIFDTLDALQPRVSQKVKAAKMFALSDRLRIIEAELAAKHINPYTKKVRSWRVLFDDSNLDQHALDQLTPEQQADAVVGRVKAVGAVPNGEGLVTVDNYATRSIGMLKAPGAAAAFMLVLTALGMRNALGDVHTALDGQQTQAEWMLASAVTGTIGAGFDVVRTGIAAMLERPSLVGPLADIVGPTWLKFAEAGGAAGGAVAMLIAAAVDFSNARHAELAKETGVAVLYGLRMIPEVLAGAQLGIDLLAACGWEVGIVILSDPAMWVAVVAIIVVGAVITLVEEPKPMKWAEACYFGVKPNADYSSDEAREQSDFTKALAG